jgi:hypothetical protein
MKRKDMSRCSRCGVIQTTENTYPKLDSKIGLRSLCKKCDLERVKGYTSRNSERIKLYKKEYYKRRSMYVKQHVKEFRAKNVERLKKKAREAYAKNPVRVREYQSRLLPRIRIWCNRTLRRHKNKGFVVNITIDDLYNFALTAKTCPHCGNMLDWTPKPGRIKPLTPALDRVNNDQVLDHVWDGTDVTSVGAVQITCHECGRRKQRSTHLEFVAYCKWVADKHA